MAFFRNERNSNLYNKLRGNKSFSPNGPADNELFGEDQPRDENVNKYNVQTLSDIARGMQYCVNSAGEIIEKHYIDMFSRYFDEKGNPYIQTFKMENGYKIDVPLFLMMGYNSMNLDEMTVKLMISLKEMEQKEYSFVGDGKNGEETNIETSRTRFMVSLASENEEGTPGNQNVTIEMKFKAGDPPEAVSKVIETFANTIVPEKIETDECDV